MPVAFSMKRKVLLHGLSSLVLLSSMIASRANADLIGMADGLTYHKHQIRQVTLGIAGRVQDEAQSGSVRLAFPMIFSKQLLFYIEAETIASTWDNLAINADVELSGNGSGGGFYYSGIPQGDRFRTLFRLSVNERETGADSVLAIAGRQAIATTEQRNVTAALLFSPVTPIADNGLNGYLALGLAKALTRRNVAVDRRNEPSFSRERDTIEGYLAAGLVYPYKKLQFFAVAEYQETLALNLGIRWQIKNLAGND